MAVIALGALGIAIYFASGDVLVRGLVYVGITLAPGVAFVGIGLRQRSVDRVPRLVVGGAYCLVGLGNAILVGATLTGTSLPYPSPADLLAVIGYVLLVPGVMLLFRRVLVGRDVGTFLETGVIALAAGLVIWLVAMAPVLNTGVGGELLTLLASLAYPAIDVALMILVVQLLLGPRSQSRGPVLLAAAFGTVLVTDLVYARLSAAGAYTPGDPIDGGWLAASVLAATAALAPGAFRAVGDEVRIDRSLSVVRSMLLGVALIVPPATIVAQVASGDDSSLIVGRSRASEARSRNFERTAPSDREDADTDHRKRVQPRIAHGSELAAAIR